MNITVRNVLEDNDSLMTYAQSDVYGFVMLFNQKLNSESNEKMKQMTEDLVDLAQSCGGSFYLPYRLHYNRKQLLLSYPRVSELFQLKLKYDPSEIFQNKFYLKYKGIWTDNRLVLFKKLSYNIWIPLKITGSL